MTWYGVFSTSHIGLKGTNPIVFEEHVVTSVASVNINEEKNAPILASRLYKAYTVVFPIGLLAQLQSSQPLTHLEA
jgi:hypothetical protein